MRRPIGDSGVASGSRCASAASALSRSVFSVLTRRSTGARSAERPARRRRLGAETLGEGRRQPFRKIAARHARARRRDRRSAKRSRSASVSGDGAWPSPVNSAAISSTPSPRDLLQRADHFRARRRLAHQPGRGRLAAQRVVDEARDRRRGRRSRRSDARGPSPSARRPRDAGAFRCRREFRWRRRRVRQVIMRGV